MNSTRALGVLLALGIMLGFRVPVDASSNIDLTVPYAGATSHIDGTAVPLLAGYRYLVLEARLTNHTQYPIGITPSSFGMEIDGSGIASLVVDMNDVGNGAYGLKLPGPGCPSNAEVASGKSLSCWLAFSVPVNSHIATITYGIKEMPNAYAEYRFQVRMMP